MNYNKDRSTDTAPQHQAAEYLMWELVTEIFLSQALKPKDT